MNFKDWVLYPEILVLVLVNGDDPVGVDQGINKLLPGLKAVKIHGWIELLEQPQRDFQFIGTQ